MSVGPVLAEGAGVAGQATEPPGPGPYDAVDVVVLGNIREVFWVRETAGGWGEAGVSGSQGSWRTSNLCECWSLRSNCKDKDDSNDHVGDNSKEFVRL